MLHGVSIQKWFGFFHILTNVYNGSNLLSVIMMLLISVEIFFAFIVPWPLSKAMGLKVSGSYTCCGKESRLGHLFGRFFPGGYI